MNGIAPEAWHPSRHPAQAAGRFYPEEPEILSAKIDADFAAASPSPFHAKMIVMPHAGIDYSGLVAAEAARALGPPQGLRRAVILGPNHRVPLDGLAVHPAATWSTPLGDAPVAVEALRAILPLDGVALDARPFRGEHSLELPLIFLQRLVPGLEIAPVLVGEAAPELVEAALERLWGGPETAICVSSDLSHFLCADAARKIDDETRALVETGEWRELGRDNACGYYALRGAIRRAESLRMRATGVAFATSDQAGGPRERVVGYGAFAFEAPEAARLCDADRRRLLAVACASLAFAAARGGRTPRLRVGAAASPALTARRAVFVTLERDGNLRGCIGSLLPRRALVDDVAANAIGAGFRDPRFPGLDQDELADLTIAVSILSPAAPIRCDDEDALIAALKPGEDGLILREGRAGALFLPSVWRELSSPRDFVRHLKRKMGVSADHWSNAMTASRFSTESFGGPFAAPEKGDLGGIAVEEA
jgi:AmmeMemoRadiSam system protein B/AmmeMemoRadiSam system protein A